ncbi:MULTISPECIES: hypothetical protein [Leptolyngbya]|uniref:hypothetical protein n=1 Tax=Leptolyngbya TaxID=47251 RepID=UPI001683D10B|nr:hypothetical protein [Leptolyngbya sp. FACHB-1624]MBD1856723.1 hypothetical protein [Leptolyngbya sp. FACHB-1624]
MKQLINAVSILGLIAAPISIGVVYAQPHTTQISKAQATSARDNFPINQPQLVTFQKDVGFQRLSDRQQLDQLRDWLLLTVVSGKNLSSKSVNQSLYDLPPVRYGYMQPVANFEYGTTRSLYIGEGQVIALVPKSISKEQRLDDLAHIVDRHRKDLGKQPKSVTVFEYDIAQTQQTATLTRTQELEAKQLFAPESGYYEAEIRSINDLQTFMAQVDDVTFSQMKSDQLTLGGRKLHSRKIPKIPITDVAALWQSEQTIQQQMSRFEAKWNEKLKNAPASQRDQIEKSAIAEGKQLKLVNGSGFSLDPSYNFSQFQKVLAALKPGLQAIAQSGAITSEDIQNAEKGIAARNEVPYLELVDKLEKSSDPEVQRFGQFAHVGELTTQYQIARYDGELEGTEVGMILFYTDLLAKLWAINYIGTTPTQAIPDFIPLTRVKVSSIHAAEMAALPNTRLWFGTQDQGFQVAEDGNQLLFGRNATRIYAAASNPLKPGVESTAAADSASFLDWWNDHYEEVARYEPQYERLNQIMKWSMIINWLNQAKAANRLGFLKEVNVDRGYWFPDWAKAQGDRLRFQQWEKIKFSDRANHTTETMPLLMSDPSEPRTFRGGVSLADQSLFKARKPLKSSSEIGELGRRSTIDYGTVSAKESELSFQTLDKTAYKLKSINNSLSESTVQAKAGSKFRSAEAELSGQAIQYKVTQTQSRLQIDTKIGETEFGTFSATKQRNGFVVGFLSRDLDNGLNLGLLLSRDKRPIETILQNTDGIEMAMKSQSQSPEYFIKLSDSERWIKVAEEAGGGGSQPPIKPPDQWDLRVGDLGDDSRKLRFTWVDDRAVQASAGQLKPVYRAATTDTVEDSAGFGKMWREQQYRRIARQIEVEPSRFILFKQQYLKKALKKVDRELNTGNTTKTEQRLDHLQQLYGAEPAIVLRRAVLELKQGRLKVERIISKESRSSKTFFDEINGLLGQKNVEFNRIETDKAFFYVQDHPGLNNLDWSIPIEQSVGGSGARVYQILPGDIPHAKFHVDGLNDASASTHTSTHFKGVNFLNTLRNTQSNQEDRCEQPTAVTDNSNPNCPQTKPVYVIMTDS